MIHFLFFFSLSSFLPAFSIDLTLGVHCLLLSSGEHLTSLIFARQK